jgi:hypothetical protein
VFVRGGNNDRIRLPVFHLQYLKYNKEKQLNIHILDPSDQE